MSLIQKIQEQMLSDDTDDSDRLEALYDEADEAGKKLIDDALICICGYSMASLRAL